MNIGHLLIQPQMVHRRLSNEEAHLADLIEEFATRFVENISTGGSGSARASVVIAFKSFLAEYDAPFKSWWQPYEAKLTAFMESSPLKTDFFKAISFSFDGLWKFLQGLPSWIAQWVEYLQPEKLTQHLNTMVALLPKDLDLNDWLKVVIKYGFHFLKKLEEALKANLVNGDRSEDSFVNYAFSVQLRTIRRRLRDELDALLPLDVPRLELSKWVEPAKTAFLDWLSNIGWKDLLKQYAGQMIEIVTSVSKWFAPATRAKIFSLVEPYWVKIQTLKPLFTELRQIRNGADLKKMVLSLKTVQTILDFLSSLVHQGLNALKPAQLTINLNVLMSLCEKDLGLGAERCQDLFLGVFQALKTVSTGVAIDIQTFQLSVFSWDVPVKNLVLQVQQGFAKLPLPQFEATPNGLKVRLEVTGSGWEKEIEQIENQLLTLKKDMLSYPERMAKIWQFIEENIWNKIKPNTVPS